MKNKNALIASVVLLLVVIVGGVMVVRWLGAPGNPQSEEEEQRVQLPPADPSIVVDLQSKPDSRSVILTVSKIPKGTTSVEYELSYLTDEGLPKGALGKIDLNGKTEVNRDILLGTCSTGGKCTYDTGVTSVQLVLRFNHPDGATQFSHEYPLE